MADAYALLGTRFVHQGRKAGVGLDCIGVVGVIARDRGTPEGAAWEADRSTHAYGRQPHPRLFSSVERFVDRIPPEDAGLGDIVLTRINERDPQHFAIIVKLDPPYMIHASNSVGRVVENRLDQKWRSRILRAYRYRGIK